VDVDGSDTHILLDGKQLMQVTVARERRFAGKLGFFVQQAKVEFKGLELRK
jgi:hypothetical protein